jgi:hypothetical protein
MMCYNTIYIKNNFNIDETNFIPIKVIRSDDYFKVTNLSPVIDYNKKLKSNKDYSSAGAGEIFKFLKDYYQYDRWNRNITQAKHMIPVRKLYIKRFKG